jgi:hypothetical protein
MTNFNTRWAQYDTVFTVKLSPCSSQLGYLHNNIIFTGKAIAYQGESYGTPLKCKGLALLANFRLKWK